MKGLTGQRQRADVHAERVDDIGGQRLDLHRLARANEHAQRAAHRGRFACEVHRHVEHDLFAHYDFLEVGVQNRASERVLLHVTREAHELLAVHLERDQVARIRVCDGALQHDGHRGDPASVAARGNRRRPIRLELREVGRGGGELGGRVCIEVGRRLRVAAEAHPAAAAVRLVAGAHLPVVADVVQEPADRDRRDAPARDGRGGRSRWGVGKRRAHRLHLDLNLKHIAGVEVGDGCL